MKLPNGMAEFQWDDSSRAVIKFGLFNIRNYGFSFPAEQHPTDFLRPQVKGLLDRQVRRSSVSPEVTNARSADNVLERKLNDYVAKELWRE
jgi:hypothetical protein